MNAAKDAFYVGYQKQAPAPLRSFLRLVAVLLPLSALLLAAALAAAQKDPGPGVFEFGIVRSFEGRLIERPQPLLVVETPDGSSEQAFFLVAAGKHGAGPLVEGLDDRPVRLQGSLVYREGLAMIEVIEDSVQSLGEAELRSGNEVDLGVVEWSGEIVDSKCFLGVMKPAEGTAHRACARLCVLGGIPPAMVVGDDRFALLVGPGREPFDERLLPWIGVPVTVKGRLWRSSDLLILETDLDDLRSPR